MNIIQLFKRSTNSKSFIPEIDGLRFFAIFTVIIYHMNTAYLKYLHMDIALWKQQVGIADASYFAWWIIRLDIGVKVFFAISGFILALPFIKQFVYNETKINIGEYFYRRLTRLEPPFVITLILFYFVHILFKNESLISLMPHFFSGLAYSHVFAYGEPNPINPVTWSLETEAQFYIILPLLFSFIFLFKNRFWNISVIILLFVGSIFAKQYLLFNQIDFLSSSILAYLSNFMVGAIFAYLYLKFSTYFNEKKYLIYDLVGLISIFIMFYFYKPQSIWSNNVLLNCSIFGLFISVFKGRFSNWFYTRPLIYIIGGMCYSLYLIHYAFFYYIIKFTGKLTINANYFANFGIQALVMLPILLIVGGLFYLIIEKPCMDKNWPTNLKNKIIALIKN